MPLYVFQCPTHGRIEVLLPTRQRPYYLCERCGQICDRGVTTIAARLEGSAFGSADEGWQPNGLSARED